MVRTALRVQQKVPVKERLHARLEIAEHIMRIHLCLLYLSRVRESGILHAALREEQPLFGICLFHGADTVKMIPVYQCMASPLTAFLQPGTVKLSLARS